jgi:hypothetical protein
VCNALWRGTNTGGQPGKAKEGRKDFFFEKKKQKTFIP